MALILSMTRIAQSRLEKPDSTIMESVTKEDMENSVKLLEFFKNQARVLHGGKRTSTDDFSMDLARFLEENGGKWEGLTNDLFAEIQSEMKAPDVRAFGQQLVEVSKRSPLLKLDKKHKKKGTFITLEIMEGVRLLSPCHKEEEEEDNSLYIYPSHPGDKGGDKGKTPCHPMHPEEPRNGKYTPLVHTRRRDGESLEDFLLRAQKERRGK